MFIPSLRERQEDIITLAEFFLEKYSFLLGKQITSFDPEVKELFLAYHWPGNVRELENVIEYAVNFEKSSTIRKNSLPQMLLKASHTVEKSRLLKLQQKKWEYETIFRMMEEMALRCRLKSHCRHLA